MGVDCLKTDFGERIPTAVVWHDGSDPERMHNYYSYLYNKVVFSVLEEKFGKGNAVVFARSATAGSQQFPVHWGGDCWATYESMAESLRGGLSLCLSGFAFWSHDIGGFEDTATPDIYKRWIAFGLLSSHSRLHGSSSYRVPWMFDEESVDVLRYFVNLKCSLMPYIFGLACEARSTGIPVMRPMVMEFMDDPTCDYIDRQYMLGDSLLVAPVFHPDGSVTYYLPEGTWTHFMTGEKVEGGRWITERHGYMSLPLMVRPGSIVAVGSDDTRPDYDYADGVTLHVFEPQAGETASTTVYSPTGEPELDVTVQLNDNELLINAQGKGKPWSILLREIYEVESTAGAAASLEENGVRITPDDYRNCTARVVLKQEGRCIGDD
jgi:alpha-D-xyloside xylohydrolase